MNNALVVFIKNPIPGKVKTRLAKSVGFDMAADLYKRLVERNIAEIKPLHRSVCDCWIAYDPPDCEDQMRRWLSQDFLYIAQQGQGLTQRLTNAFTGIFARGYTSVAVLGSDTLKFRKELITQTFEKLRSHDIVIGPAKDGGYYLIGLNKFSSQIFENINWSTDKVLAETLIKSQMLKWNHSLLDELDDLDEFKNVQAISGKEV